jgi:hypothetical protein
LDLTAYIGLSHTGPVGSDTDTLEEQDMAQTGVTYQAAWTPQDQEVTVVRDVYAGISGPFGSYPAANREEAAAALFGAGYLVDGSWKVSSLGDHWVPLAPMA